MAATSGIRTVASIARHHRWSPFRPGAFGSALHNPRTATVIGRLLGGCVAICFLTGLYSHFLQEPAQWMVFATGPSWLYRLTQGAHVATGIAAIPLLLAKLWTVFPRLFSWPPVTSPAHAAERLSIAVLVSATLLQLFMGLLNTVKWYPWPFSFRTVHFWLAWIIVGSLLLHIAVKLPSIMEHWRRHSPGAVKVNDGDDGWTRRGFFGTVGVATAAVTLTTVGQSVSPLGSMALLAPRQPYVGPQGLPINRTAEQAGIGDQTDWRLEIVGNRTVRLSLAELNALPQHEAELPIACVEGWSQAAQWGGVRIKDLLALVSAPPDARLQVTSAQTKGAYASSQMGPEFIAEDTSLLALRLHGQVLHIDHGYPARIISPARPGVLQTKWVRRLEVMT